MSPARLITWVLSGIIPVVSLRVLPAVVGPMVAGWRLGPKGQERPGVAVPGWGDAFDPDEDCRFRIDGASLHIDVPGRLHDLSVERAKVNAPRVLRAVEGDFVAEVAVAGAPAPGGDRASSYAPPYHGTGLLLWLDRDNYIRLERAAILRENNLFHYLNFERRPGADMADTAGVGVPDGPIALRLERRGSRVAASYRIEGGDWVQLPRELSVRGWGRSLLVGVAAVNTSTEPFAAELHDFVVAAGTERP